MQRVPLLWRPLNRPPVFPANGDAKDPTRPQALYNETYAFLVACRTPEIK
ncbi:hypothetical protein GCM10022269_07240 [Sphingorhabdus rigui]